MARNATLLRWVVGPSFRESGHGLFFIIAIVIYFLFSLSGNRVEGTRHYKRSKDVEQVGRMLPTRVQLGSNTVKDCAGKVYGSKLVCSNPLFPRTVLHVEERSVMH